MQSLVSVRLKRDSGWLCGLPPRAREGALGLQFFAGSCRNVCLLCRNFVFVQSDVLQDQSRPMVYFKSVLCQTLHSMSALLNAKLVAELRLCQNLPRFALSFLRSFPAGQDQCEQQFLRAEGACLRAFSCHTLTVATRRVLSTLELHVSKLLSLLV